MKANSFAEYIKESLYDKISKGVNDFYWKHRALFRIEETSRVQNIFESYVDDITIKHVNVEDVDEKSMRVRFYPIVVVSVVANGRTKYDVEELTEDFWLRLTCTGDISKELNDLTIEKVEEFDKKQRLTYAMTDHLVPYIPPERLDEFALRILTHYYSEALETDGPVDAYELAKRMGLTVRKCRITKDGSVFGRIYFYEALGEIYLPKEDKMKKGWIEPKTVLIDKTALILNACQNENITVAHECTHYAIHRKAFEFRRLCDKKLSHIQCETTGDIQGIDRQSEASYMEYHATEIAPRIVMPKPSFVKKVDSIIHNTLLETGYSDIIDVIESVITQVAEFYKVPKSVAKKRMVDAGYEDAIGALIYIDGQYVKPHRASQKGILGKKQTYTISERDMVVEVACNQELYKRVSAGHYAFVDSHLVLNTSKYVERDAEGNSMLTRYARLHMEECCLTFEIEFRDATKYNEQYYSICVLNRDCDSPYEFDIRFRNGFEHTPEKHKAILDEAMKKDYELMMSLPQDFKGIIETLKKNKDLRNCDIAENANLDLKKVERIINGHIQNPLINDVVAICLALKIPPMICDYVIEKSNTKFTNSYEHYKLRFLMHMSAGKDMDDIRNDARKLGIIL